MTTYEKGEDDRDVVDWKRNLVVTNQLKQYQLNAVKDQIESKLNAITPEDWTQFSHGAHHTGKEHAKAMICYAICFNDCFPKVDYGIMLDFKDPNHNMNVNVNIFVCKRIIEVFKNNINQEVFEIVESICQHILYKDQDKNNSNWQFKKLFAKGTEKITRRKAKLNTKASPKERKQDNQQDKHNKN